jgi:type I restriction enzyme M protein
VIEELRPYPAIEDSEAAHAPDAWSVPESVKTGYEISVTRCFYKPQPSRTLEEIWADVLALEREAEMLLATIVGERRPEPTR